MKLTQRYTVTSFRPEGDRYLSLSLRDYDTGHEIFLVSISPGEIARWINHREPFTDQGEIKEKILAMLAAGPGSLP